MSFAHRTAQKRIAYLSEINVSDTTWFDSDVLQKILENLISNAVKYTPTGGAVSINAQLVANTNLVFSIRNDLEKTKKVEVSKMFERFYQADSTTEGVGIGLAMVKELVAFHKGQILVNTLGDQQIQFTVTLPVSKSRFTKAEIVSHTPQNIQYPSSPENKKQLQSAESNDKPLVLLVEDDNDMAYYIKSHLVPTYTVIEANNGREGLILAKNKLPDIIITDVMMPEMNGMALCEILKTDEHTSHIPIIMLTAKAGEENELIGLEVGADAFMLKPFKKKKLLLQLDKLLESRRLLRKRYSQQLTLQPKDIAINSTEEKFLNRLQAVLDKNLQNPDFTAEAFAQEIGMSRMQLHRKLTALTDLSTTEFLRSQRVKAAHRLIQESDATIAEIAYQVGFSTPSYFIQCFKKVYGQTPNQIRASV